ncbi:MAG: PQQ-binding-like beta-propeller repeat protein [Microcoleaceae cyanobacterium]
MLKQMMKQTLVCLLILVLSAVSFGTAPAMADYIVHDRPSKILSNPDPAASIYNFSGRGTGARGGILGYKFKPVAIDGDRFVIGAYTQEVDGYGDAGAVYLYDKSNENVISILNPSPESRERFGASIALDGDTLVISAPAIDKEVTYGNPHENFGEVHLFKASTGELLQTFSRLSVGRINLGFGCSVAVDGDSVLIGTKSSQAYLFKASTGELLQTFSDPSPETDKRFGEFVALDGDSVLIGSPVGYIPEGALVSGEAYLFKASTGELVQTFSDPSPQKYNYFGESIAIDGDSVLIGAYKQDVNGYEDAGKAYLFKASTGKLVQTFSAPSPMKRDSFGRSLDIDGNNVLFGVFNRDVYGRQNAGEAYLFDASTGELKDVFLPPSINKLDYFGDSVAMDGDSVLIGAPAKTIRVNGRYYGSGEAYLYSSVIQPACDNGYVQNPTNNHCYSLTAPTSWVGAQQKAENAGGNLVTINDQAEQDWLIDTFGDQSIVDDMPPSFWIGFTNKDEGDISDKDRTELAESFKWVSGESSGFTSWDTNEPNNYNNSGERYADVCAKKGKLCSEVGVWNDRGKDWPQLKGIIERS